MKSVKGIIEGRLKLKINEKKSAVNLVSRRKLLWYSKCKKQSKRVRRMDKTQIKGLYLETMEEG